MNHQNENPNNIGTNQLTTSNTSYGINDRQNEVFVIKKSSEQSLYNYTTVLLFSI